MTNVKTEQSSRESKALCSVRQANKLFNVKPTINSAVEQQQPLRLLHEDEKRVGLVLPHYPLKPDAATETKWRGRKFTREKPLLFPRKSPWKPKTCVAFTFDFVTKGCKNLQGRFSLAIFSLNLDHWRCIIIFRFEKFFSLSNVKFRKHCIIQCRKRKVHQIPSRIVVLVALNKAQMLWWARRKKQKMHWMIGTIEKVFLWSVFHYCRSSNQFK